MPSDLTVRASTSCVALAAFCVALLAGVWVDNPLDTTLSRAILALLGGACVGVTLGLVLQAGVIAPVAAHTHRVPGTATNPPTPSAPKPAASAT